MPEQQNEESNKAYMTEKDCETTTTVRLKSNSTYSICCGFVVQQAVQQVHNKSTTSRNVVQQVHNKSNKWSLTFRAQKTNYILLCIAEIQSFDQRRRRGAERQGDKVPVPPTKGFTHLSSEGHCDV